MEIETWLSGKARQVITGVRKSLAGNTTGQERSTSDDSLAEPAWTPEEIERRRSEHSLPKPVKPGIDEVSQDPEPFPLDGI